MAPGSPARLSTPQSVLPMTVHVHPVNDLVEHDIEGDECLCGATWEFIDPDTGEAHGEPLVIHHSLDGREHQEG